MQKAASPSTSTPYTTSIRFFGIARGWALDAQGNLLKTQNGGTTWELPTPPYAGPPNLNSMSFISPDTGWVTASGRVIRTTDGGTTWQVRSVATSGRPVVTFLTSDSGWLFGQNVSFYRTMDSGSTYKGKDFDLSGGYNYIRNQFFVDARMGWVFTDFNLYRNTEGENIWTKIFTSTQIRSVFFANRNVGWLAGDSGMIYKSVDGGIVWAAQASGTPITLRAIHFLNADTGWMVGDTGVVLKTVNGGLLWNKISTGTNENLTAVYFANSRTGWVLGQNGTIFKTVGADEPVGILSKPQTSSPFALTGGWLNYHLDQPSEVTIIMRDLQGRPKAILFNGPQTAGDHTLDLAALQLSSGTYLLDFQDNRGRTMKPLFLP